MIHVTVIKIVSRVVDIVRTSNNVTMSTLLVTIVARQGIMNLDVNEGKRPQWKRYTVNVYFAECESNTYGSGCLEKCGHCLRGEKCNHFNGICNNGCEAGYYNFTCKAGIISLKINDKWIKTAYVINNKWPF